MRPRKLGAAAAPSPQQNSSLRTREWPPNAILGIDANTHANSRAMLMLYARMHMRMYVYAYVCYVCMVYRKAERATFGLSVFLISAPSGAAFSCLLHTLYTITIRLDWLAAIGCPGTHWRRECSRGKLSHKKIKENCVKNCVHAPAKEGGEWCVVSAQVYSLTSHTDRLSVVRGRGTQHTHGNTQTHTQTE